MSAKVQDGDSGQLKKACRRLATNPSKTISLASKGSYWDLAALLREELKPVPDKLRNTLFEAILVHLRKAPKEAKDRSGDLSLAYLSLQVLGRFGEEFFKRNDKEYDQLLRVWPMVLKWMRFLFDTLTVNGMETSFSRFLHCICMTTKILCSREVPIKIVETRGMVKFCARLWLRSYEKAVDERYAATIVWTTRAFAASSALDILQSLSSSEHQVANTATSRLRSAIRHPTPDVDSISTHWGVIVTMLYHENQDHPVIEALLDNYTIPLILDTLSGSMSKLTRHPAPIAQCFQILNRHLAKVTYIRQALRHGLLRLVMLVTGRYEELDDSARRLINAFMFCILPRSLAFSSTLSLISTETKNLEATGIMSQPFPGTFRRHWGPVERLLAERMILKELYHRKGRSSFYFCHNTHCRNRGKEKRIYKCAGCGVVYYCSKECQRTSWRDSDHRTLCAFAMAERRSQSLTRSDRNFIIYIAINELCRHYEYRRAIIEDANSRDKARQFRTFKFRLSAVEFDFYNHPPKIDLTAFTERLESFDRVRFPYSAALRDVIEENARRGDERTTFLKLRHPGNKQAEAGVFYHAIEKHLYEPDPKQHRKHCILDAGLAAGGEARVPLCGEDDGRWSRECTYDEVDELLRRAEIRAHREGCVMWNAKIIETVVKEYFVELERTL